MLYHVCDINPYPQSNPDKKIKEKSQLRVILKKYLTSTPNCQVIKNKKGLRNFLRSLGQPMMNKCNVLNGVGSQMVS